MEIGVSFEKRAFYCFNQQLMHKRAIAMCSLKHSVTVNIFFLCFLESFSWTVQPANQTEVIIGEDKSLTWKYTLTADEQTKSQT